MSLDASIKDFIRDYNRLPESDSEQKERFKTDFLQKIENDHFRSQLTPIEKAKASEYISLLRSLDDRELLVGLFDALGKERKPFDFRQYYEDNKVAIKLLKEKYDNFQQNKTKQKALREL